MPASVVPARPPILGQLPPPAYTAEMHSQSAGPERPPPAPPAPPGPLPVTLPPPLGDGGALPAVVLLLQAPPRTKARQVVEIKASRARWCGDMKGTSKGAAFFGERASTGVRRQPGPLSVTISAPRRG